MKNTFGSNLTVTIFGESHGPAVGCVIDGLAPGIEINNEYLRTYMAKRQSRGDISTPRKEDDEVEFLSGVKNGVTEGTPVCLIVRNKNIRSDAYAPYETVPRPSHADYTAECKYHGYQDKAGGGHFSGRITAALVAAGAIINWALMKKDIFIASHIKSLGGISDSDFIDYHKDAIRLAAPDIFTLSDETGAAMRDRILEAKEKCDSIGGVIEAAITGVPAGVGEPWFDTVEGIISHALFSIPGIKGVEFGDGFAITEKMGSAANDPFGYENGSVITTKNSSGGIQGGITNGMPIIVRMAVKPTPSIARSQHSVDLSTGENTEICIVGRHDPSIAVRACAVVNAVLAIAVADTLVTRFGTDWLGGEK